MSIELITFLAMVAVFLLGCFLCKLPVSISMVLSAVAGALVAGRGIPLRHLVEGMFSYVDTIMVIATAMIFMKVIQESGALDAVSCVIIEKFHKLPALMLCLIMIIIMFPGMITGSSTASVLSAGSIMAPVLMMMGVPMLETACILAMGGILGMIAPPTNLPAMVIGAGIDITKPDGHMVVDIGGGTADIAVISLGGVVESASIKVAGDKFDEAVIKYIRRKHNVLIGDRTAEELKINIGCVFPRPEEVSMEIKGRCLMTGLPRVFNVTSSEMIEAFEETSNSILEAIHGVLERTPPELVADISTNGIIMTGGGSLLWGFDKLVQSHTGIETHVADDAISCVAYGTGKSLESLDQMQEGTMNLSRRKQMNY